MSPCGPVHFVYLGGPFTWQHLRAVETARVHGVPRVLWHAVQVPMSITAFSCVEGDEDDPTGLEMRWLDLPAWLRDHPIRLANVKDLYLWRILHEYGGLYLDLDTISLRPVWDLLKRDVLVSTEWPDLTDPIARHPYNSAVVAARAGAAVLDRMAATALLLLEDGESGWGRCGPHLLTDAVAGNRDAFDAAPFGVLSGWRDDTVEAGYYDRVEAGLPPEIGEDVRVLHLYSSSRPERFLADRWTP